MEDRDKMNGNGMEKGIIGQDSRLRGGGGLLEDLAQALNVCTCQTSGMVIASLRCGSCCPAWIRDGTALRNGTGRPHISWEQNAPIRTAPRQGRPLWHFQGKRLKTVYIEAGRNGMGTDNDRIHVCVRLKKDEEDYLCGIASVRISDGITICGIRIYYCRGRLSVVYPCLVKENKRLPVLVLGKAEKERLTALILDAFESERLK